MSYTVNPVFPPPNTRYLLLGFPRPLLNQNPGRAIMKSMKLAAPAALLLAALFLLHGCAPQAPAPIQSQFLHHVYFWLNEPSNPNARNEFLTAIRKMQDIPSVRHSAIGTPAGIERDVADTSWTFYWLVTFDDRAGYDVYDKHPLHDEFRTNSALWKKVLVYDVIPEK